MKRKGLMTPNRYDRGLVKSLALAFAMFAMVNAYVFSELPPESIVGDLMFAMDVFIFLLIVCGCLWLWLSAQNRRE